MKHRMASKDTTKNEGKVTEENITSSPEISLCKHRTVCRGNANSDL